MPQRKKRSKLVSGVATASPDVAGSEPSVEPSEDQVNRVPPPKEDDGRHGKAPRGSLKEFVEQYKDKHFHVIETRIVLICSFGIFMKLFYSDERELTLTHTNLLFLGLCIIVIIFSTWMDYFPSKLVDVQPRKSRGQGIPMASLLLPMVCSAQLYFSLHFAKHFTGLFELYQVLLCVCSLCSLLATLLHSIPHPNHVIFYNFSVLILAYIIQLAIGVSMWIVVPTITVYSLLGAWLLNSCPGSFTLGEVMIVAQGLTVVFLDSALQLLSLHGLITLPEHLTVLRSESVLYIELLIVGVAVCCLLLSPALYKLSQAKYYHERKFWSGTFIFLSLSIGFMMILPWLGRLLGGYHPIVYVLFYSVSSPVRLVLIVFWLVVCVLTGILIYAQSSDSSWASCLKTTSSSRWWIRKLFHLSALLVFLTGTALSPNFISMAASIVTFLFMVAELGRIFWMWPFGEYLQQLFFPLLNDTDSGLVIVSDLYLLLSFSLPLWLCPITNYAQVAKLSMYSGTLSLGIGDSVAAIVGNLYGKVKWPGTKKTIEGSIASIFTQLLGVLIITVIDPDLQYLSGNQWMRISGIVAITTALEAYTWQIDNLILGVFQYAIMITFLN